MKPLRCPTCLQPTATITGRRRIRRFLNAPVEKHLSLDFRTANALHFARIETIGQLCEMTPREMLAIRNFGRKSLQHLASRLALFTLDGIPLRFGMFFGPLLTIERQPVVLSSTQKYRNQLRKMGEFTFYAL